MSRRARAGGRGGVRVRLRPCGTGKRNRCVLNPSPIPSVRAIENQTHRWTSNSGPILFPNSILPMAPSPNTPPPLSHEEETIIAFSHLLEDDDLPPEARATVPVPAPSTDDVVERGIDELSAQIWDWAEQFPAVDQALTDRLAEMDPGDNDDGGVAGMDVGDVSLPGEGAGGPSDAPGANRPGVDEPGTSQVGGQGIRRTGRGGRGGRGGRSGMTGDRPGSPRDAAASDLEDTEGLYVLRNAVNLARDLARTMRDIE